MTQAEFTQAISILTSDMTELQEGVDTQYSELSGRLDSSDGRLSTIESQQAGR